MNNKNDKVTFTSSVTSRQQTTSVSRSTSSTSSTSGSYVSPYRSNSAKLSNTSSSTKSTSQYQSVYCVNPSYNMLLSKPPTIVSPRAPLALGFSHSVNKPATPSVFARLSPLTPNSTVRKPVLPLSGSGITNDAKPFGAYPRAIKSSASSTTVERYNLRTGKGYVLIFHHKHFKDNKSSIREGSEKDLKLLKEFFAKYRVKQPDICEDYTVERMRKKMAEIAKKSFNSYSCLLVIVMSHGETRERIQAYDAMFNFETEVVERVLMNETLKDKPKVFFIQACKGNARMETDFVESATNKIDIMKCYSTYEGTVSFRDTKTGTYFIQELFKLIDSHGDKDLTELMVLLRRRFSEDRIQQAPTDMSTLSKKFFFSDLK